MRFLTGGISHEVNVFLPRKADLEHIKKTELLYGEEIFNKYKNTKTVMGAYIDASENLGFELIPTIKARAGAFGIVTKEAYGFFLEKLLEKVRGSGEIDGILLCNHGAGYAEDHPDMEGHMYEEIRKIVGDKVPMANVYDWHANHTEKMVNNLDITVGYDTYPHVDSYERGLEGAELLFKVAKGEIKPKTVLVKPPLLLSLQAQNTNRYPLTELFDMIHDFEKKEKVLVITAAGGYPWADVEDPTMAFIVTTDDDPDLASDISRRLKDFIWNHRRELLVTPMPVREAIKEAMEAEEGPYVLADIADNPGGGATSDTTVMLKALIEMRAKNTVMATVWDPEAVADAIKAGVGKQAIIKVGGKIDPEHGGKPLEVTGIVKLISNGKFINKGPMSTGLLSEMGRTVVLDCNGVEVIVVEKRKQPTDLELYRSLGIEPTEKQIIVVKSSVHYRAVHEPIAKKIIEVDAPGLVSPRLAGYPFKNLKRPLFPLDVNMLGITELKTMEEK